MRLTIGISAVLLGLWLAYAVSPFFALYSLASAVQARDVPAVTERVDFRALRGSLAAQIVRTYLRMTGKGGRPESILERFSVGIGASVADPIVAKLVNPEALLDLLRSGRPSGVFSDDVAPIEGLSSEALGNFWRAYVNSELGIARFLIDAPVDKPAEETFRLRFCLTSWAWKLCGIELPEQLQIRLAQEILKTERQ
jgi:hypothetical protein